jgi:uncharacterized membrane protein
VNTETVDRLLSRKFILALAALASATGLVAAGHIDPGVYSAVVIATVGAYITGNVVQKTIEARAE